MILADVSMKPVRIEVSTNMRDSSHNTSLLLPRVSIDSFLPDGLLRRLFKGVLISVADVPDMSHDSKRSLTELLSQGDVARPRRSGPARSLSSRAAREAQLTEEIVHTHCPLEERIDIVNVLLCCYVMVRDNNPELEVSVEFDDDGPLFLWDWVPADDPAEIAAHPTFIATSFLIVLDGGSAAGFQIAYDEAIVACIVEVVLERDGAVVLTDALLVYEDNVACVWVFPKHETKAGPWSVAEPQFEMRRQAIRRFWRFCRLPVVTVEGFLWRWRARRPDISRRVQFLNNPFSPTLAISKRIQASNQVWVGHFDMDLESGA